MNAKTDDGMQTFSEMLEEMEALSKSLDGDADDEEGDKDEDEDEGEGEEGDGDEDDLGKAITVTLGTGEKVEAYDAAPLIKSFDDRILGQEVAFGEFSKAALGLLRKQGDLIKSVTERLDALAGKPAGRKSTINVHEKRTSALDQAASGDGVSVSDFMAKAMDKMRAGRLSGDDVAQIEVFVGRGQTPPGYLLAKVLGDS